MPRTSSRAFASIGLAAIVAVWLSSVASAELESPPRFVGTEVEQDEILEIISSADARSYKPVGHSTVVLRMRTVARVTAALRVRTRRLQRGYQHEIAAYRVSRLLGLDNVPPAIYRRAHWDEIWRRFHEDTLDQRAAVRRQILWDEDGSAPSAAVYWVKGLRSVGLEDDPRWRSWLQDGDIPEGKDALARDLSAMVVFDFVIGNWDRFSGGNLPTDGARQRAFLRDNDRSFSTPLPPRRYDKLLDALTRTKRFSKAMVERLASLDATSIQRELARDPSHAIDPLLTDRQIVDLLSRRATAMSYIAALIEARSEDEVLFFP